ncbi:cytochrome P450 2K4-like [Gastrophryne carolinensis]
MTLLAYLSTRADLLLYFTTFIAFFLYWINGSKKSTAANMPPGPKPLPFIGNFNLITLKKPDQSFMELSEKYGEIFTLHLGGKKVVIITGYKAVKDALVNQADDFVERADVPIFTLAFRQKGIIFSNGQSWKDLRRFTLSALRDFGMGKKIVETKIQDELLPLIERLKSYNESWTPAYQDVNYICGVTVTKVFLLFGFEFFILVFWNKLISLPDRVWKCRSDYLTPPTLFLCAPYLGEPINPSLIMYTAVSNVICSMIFGKRFEYDDPVFKKLLRIIGENAHLFGTARATFYNYYPRMATLLGAHTKLMKNINDLTDFISRRIKYHKREYDKNNIAAYIDAYLIKQEQDLSKGATYFDDENLVYTVLDLFTAGTETTSTTLRWAILLMMKYPEIQKKVQEEIREHIKPGQMPSVEDRKNMPYTDAVIHEVQRFANIVPLNVSHTCSKDVNFRGYCIPKGTEVIPLLTSVLYDKTQWKTPYEFNPNHFLDESGKFLRKDAFMPFSAGRRVCAGEGLAKVELFLFFTGLLQSFSFHPPPGVSRKDISLKPDIGFIFTPLPHLVCMK